DTPAVGRPDVHPGTLAYRLEAFEVGQVIRPVQGLHGGSHGREGYPGRLTKLRTRAVGCATCDANRTRTTEYRRNPDGCSGKNLISSARTTGMLSVPLSVLDLATVDRGQTVGASLQGSVRLAQLAEQAGYRRVWYAEHHNFSSIASSATAVLIAHVAANTSRIRLGAGGVMLPNHAPLVLAEQFGTLASLHPDRIDRGLGRAPGTDPVTVRALRRDPNAADTFPQDVLELQGYLSDESRVPGVQAIPGRGTNVPLYILGSSLFGAQLAAKLGLPYAFASHFAPAALQQAVAVYRERFEPSEQLGEPYVIAAVNVIAADTEEEAQEQLHVARRTRVRVL